MRRYHLTIKHVDHQMSGSGGEATIKQEENPNGAWAKVSELEESEFTLEELRAIVTMCKDLLKITIDDGDEDMAIMVAAKARRKIREMEL